MITEFPTAIFFRSPQPAEPTPPDNFTRHHLHPLVAGITGGSIGALLGMLVQTLGIALTHSFREHNINKSLIIISGMLAGMLIGKMIAIGITIYPYPNDVIQNLSESTIKINRAAASLSFAFTGLSTICAQMISLDPEDSIDTAAASFSAAFLLTTCIAAMSILAECRQRLIVCYNEENTEEYTEVVPYPAF